MPLILGTNSIKDTGYDVANSLRFNSASADHLTRSTSGAGTSNTTCTISLWVKKTSTDSAARRLLEFYNNSTYYISLRFRDDHSNRLDFYSESAGAAVNLRTNREFRDTSAWTHIVMRIDTTQSTADDRLRMYVNGVQETSFAIRVNPGSSENLNFNNSGNTHLISKSGSSTANDRRFNGYMAEVCFIDGQSLDPTSFGEFDSDSPTIWKPKDVSGLTFGNNGFYLDFEDSSSLGNDVAGSNNFTLNNLTSVDQSIDTCTNNGCILNSLNAASGGTFTLDEGNLRVKGADTIEGYTSSTIGFSQGKWYFECESNFNTQGVVGITFDGNSGQVADDVRSDRYPGNATYSYGYIFSSGNKITNSSGSSYGASLATGDILGVAIDLDNMKLYFSKDGVWQNSGDPTSGSTGTGAIDLTGSGSTGFCFVTVGDNNNAGYGQIDFNFGSPFFAISSGNSDGNGYGNFEYSVPSGYYAINSKNLAEFG